MVVCVAMGTDSRDVMLVSSCKHSPNSLTQDTSEQNGDIDREITASVCHCRSLNEADTLSRTGVVAPSKCECQPPSHTGAVAHSGCQCQTIINHTGAVPPECKCRTINHTGAVPPSGYECQAINHTLNDSSDFDEDEVVLPARFCRQRHSLSNGCTHCSEGASREENTLDNRERDLEQALKWLRQERIKLKQQDRSLMRQFLGIRSSIHQLRMGASQDSRCRSSSFGSETDSKSSESSGGSIELIHCSRVERLKYNSMLADEEHLGEYRPRTVSLLPPKTRVLSELISSSSSKDKDAVY